MAAAAGIPIEKIFIKAKTMEGVGEIGTEEAMAAQAVALVSAE
jgi:2C-methyl-D-erythritol 2,4-cyclodiphosphate synthase